MSIKKAAQSSLTLQALYGRASNAGTTAGHMSSGSEPENLEQAADLRFLSWGGQDLNLRPTDYESAALTN